MIVELGEGDFGRWEHYMSRGWGYHWLGRLGGRSPWHRRRLRARGQETHAKGSIRDYSFLKANLRILKNYVLNWFAPVN